MLLVDDEVEVIEEKGEHQEDIVNCNELEGEELSMNSIVGLKSPNIMKVRGTVKGHEVVVLNDSGATNNFMSWELIKRLDLGITETNGYSVQMGTSMSVRGK